MNTNIVKPTVPLNLHHSHLNGLAQRAINRFAACQSFITLFVGVLASLITVSVSAQTNPQPSFLTNGLVAYYPFNGNPDDVSGNGNNGIASNVTATQNRFGVTGAAYQFKAENSSFVDVSNLLPKISGSKFLTVSLWFQTEEPNTGGVLFGDWDHAQPSYGFFTQLDRTQNSIFLTSVAKDSAGTGSTEAPAAADSFWHHLMIVFRGDSTSTTNRIQHYLDGAIISSSGTVDQTLASVGSGGSINIGRRAFLPGDGFWGGYFSGAIDDVRVYNRPLSTAEIKALYQHESTPPDNSFITNGLVAYYPFNGNANDESGNGNNGEVKGAALAGDRFGSKNAAFYFNGVNSYINTPVENSGSDYTLCLYYNSNELKKSALIGRDDENSNGNVFGFLTASEMCYSSIGNGLATGKLVITSITPETRVWKYAVCTVSGRPYSQVKLYLDGRLIGSGTGDYITPNMPWRVGVKGTNINQMTFHGAIDDVRIYNRALSDAEVSALYQHESTPPDNSFITNGLVAYYPFNGNAEDASGNGNAGLQVNTLPIADRFNKKSSAFAFNGTSSKVTIENKIIDMSLNGYAINFWFSPYSLNQKLNKTSENGGGVLFNNISGLGIGVSFTTYTAPQYAQYGIDDGISGAWDMSMNQNYYGAKNNYAINKWYMATLVKNGGEYTFFINSDIQDRQSNSKSYSLKDGFIIGSSFWNEYFEGAIDDVRIYNRALSSNEVAQLYAYESQPQSAWIVVQISPTFQNPVWTSVATNTVPSSGPRQFYQMRASVVESAVDLKNPIWTPVATNNLPSEPQKFYRLVAQ